MMYSNMPSIPKHENFAYILGHCNSDIDVDQLNCFVNKILHIDSEDNIERCLLCNVCFWRALADKGKKKLNTRKISIILIYSFEFIEIVVLQSTTTKKNVLLIILTDSLGFHIKIEMLQKKFHIDCIYLERC